jgi:AraC family transcriptional regulator of arabinose operon
MLPRAPEYCRFDTPLIIAETFLRRDHPEGIHRVHFNWVLQVSLSGRAIIDPGPNAFEVRPRDALLFPSMVPMRIAPIENEDWHFRWIALSSGERFDHLLHWPTRPSGVGHLQIEDADIWVRVVSALEELSDCAYRRSPVRRLDLCFNLLAKALLWMEDVNPLSHAPAEDPRVLRAVGFMKQEYGRKLTVEDLASKVHLSPSRFAHLFRQVTGQSPMRYLEAIRLDQAQQMLLGSRATLFEIARACGFCNEFYFSNVFKKRYNIRPNDFRNQSLWHRMPSN